MKKKLVCIKKILKTVGGAAGKTLWRYWGSITLFKKRYALWGLFFSVIALWENVNVTRYGKVSGTLLRYDTPKMSVMSLLETPRGHPLNISERCRLFDEFCPGGYYRNLYSGWPKTVVSGFDMCGNVVQISAPIFSKGWKMEGKFRY